MLVKLIVSHEPFPHRFGRFSPKQIAVIDKLGRVGSGAKPPQDDEPALQTPWSIDTNWVIHLPRGKHVLTAQVRARPLSLIFQWFCAIRVMDVKVCVKCVKRMEMGRENEWRVVCGRRWTLLEVSLRGGLSKSMLLPSMLRFAQTCDAERGPNALSC
eukprot:2169172-Rhodomonas_salina.2